MAQTQTQYPPPSFRRWRYVRTAFNAGTLRALPGQTFTAEQRHILTAWAQSIGLSWRVAGPASIAVHRYDTAQRLCLAYCGAAGEKLENERAAESARKRDDAERRADADKAFLARPSSGWIVRTFGDALSTYNRARLADTIEHGVAFSGLWSCRCEDALRAMSAVTAEGSVDIAAVREAYLAEGGAA